jgi:hypothetical protein
MVLFETVTVHKNTVFSLSSYEKLRLSLVFCEETFLNIALDLSGTILSTILACIVFLSAYWNDFIVSADMLIGIQYRLAACRSCTTFRFQGKENES